MAQLLIHGKNLQDGIASPNPSYPQDIEVVTGTQEVKVENKNIIDKDNFTASGTYSGVACTNNNDGSITLNGTSTNTVSYWVTPSPNYYNDSRQWGTYSYICLGMSETCYTDIYYGGQPYGSNISTFAIDRANRNYAIRLVIPSGVTLNNVVVKPMLVKGSYTASTIGEFQPHAEQTQTISLGDIELCKIGNYQDYLYKSGDKWYKKEYIGKVVLNGSETWTKGSNTYQFYMTKPTTMIGQSQLLSNYFKNQETASQNGMWAGNSILYINNLLYTQLADFKTWLSTHNTEVYYQLATPNDIEITDTTLIEQLNNLEKLMSYNGTTNISSSGNLSAILSVSAIKGES